MAHSSPQKLWYLPNHRDALQAHMHFLHKLGNAKTEVNYHAYYQTLIKDGTANGATSNAYLTSSDVPFKTKCIIMKYRTCTLYNQKHAVLFKPSTSQTCPLCPQVDSALHILSGCQHTQIRNILGATQQHRQPLVQPPTPDSTDLKTSTELGATSTSSRSSTVRTPDLRTS